MNMRMLFRMWPVAVENDFFVPSLHFLALAADCQIETLAVGGLGSGWGLQG